MTRMFVVAGLMLGMALSASVVRAQDNGVAPSDMTMPAPPMQTISPADVFQMMQSKSMDFVLVDAQPEDGYADAHIPGAMSFPWVTGKRITKFPIPLPRDKALVIYTACPVDLADLVNQLTQFGYSNFKVVTGGLSKWQQLKYPVVKGSEAMPGLDKQPTTSQNTDTPSVTVAQR